MLLQTNQFDIIHAEVPGTHGGEIYELKVVVKSAYDIHQHACLSEKFCKSAVHDLIKNIEMGLEIGQLTIRVFADFKQTFDKATFETM